MKKIFLTLILLHATHSYAQGCPEGELQFNFKDLPLKSAFALIADFGGVNAYVDPAITESRAIKFACTPWKQAAQNIAEQNNLKLSIKYGIMNVSK